MSKIYKIYPSIGIGRVGNSPDQFFIGPEIPGVTPVELIGDSEEPRQKLKDEQGRVKRQAARFRVFEFEQSEDGSLDAGREVTASEATIEWRVQLANSKAAGEVFPPDGTLRNDGVPREQLTIAPQARTICGRSQSGVEFDDGKFLGTEVYLGELRTDPNGRLVVLGGRGHSDSVPTGLPISDFANNDRWHDDVSDGPVMATVTLPGESPVEVQHPAWVIFAPPDFAPLVGGIVTLYDIAYQVAVTRGWITPPSETSFRRDIYPIVSRAASLRWTHDWTMWSRISEDWQRLSDKQDPDAQQLRDTAYTLITTAPLAQLRLTESQRRDLDQWKAGNFLDDWATTAPPPPTLTPENLNRAALDACVGGGFFPGIEAGRSMKDGTVFRAVPFISCCAKTGLLHSEDGGSLAGRFLAVSTSLVACTAP
jgi:hypothetical protein